MRACATILLGLMMISSISISAQSRRRKKNTEPAWKPVSGAEFQGLKWRQVGPFRGGRSVAVSGVPGDHETYYMGSTGGGLWKTVDAGASWRNVSDGFFKTGSVGAVAVAAGDPNVVYVGMGEGPVRGVMTSHGDGIYRSTDAGKTWMHLGLEDARQISKIRIDPRNPDIAYAAVQGSPYAPTKTRGVYRTRDGGKTWDQVLYVDSLSGVSDLSMDMRNPRILYAAFWSHQRLPWQMQSGGAGSGMWKSTDGGDTWKELSKGLPDGVMGKIGVSVSPANPNRVWAIIEAEKGGLFRSDDAGRSWKLINPDRILRARSWYYMHVFADPQDAETVHILNAPYMRSTDGGKTFKRIPTPHGDNHDLWIHPDNNRVMINGNDGGANISYNQGKTWSKQSNQPTAQFYRVNADNLFPYNIYGGQQDNSSVAIPSQVDGRGIRNEDFHSVGGCESAYCAFDPDNPRFIYAGCYQGIITEYDSELESETDVMAYPFLGLGTTPGDVRYRFNWNAPIIVSQHDTKVIYHAGNKLLKSSDRGRSWEEISPDLTRNLEEHFVPGGGPITNEAAGGEIYHTILYVAESPQDAQTIWVGSDDGLVHITRDGGANWTPITPPGMGEGMVNAIEVSTHNDGEAWLAFTRYKFNDFRPHIYHTTDYGQSWTETVQGIAPEAHLRVVRSDPAREGLLYAGTETGLYISFDKGAHWQPFQRNLPIVPITDLKVHQGDLIAATQGRAFWVLDDIAPIHQIEAEREASVTQLLPIRTAYRFGGSRRDSMSDRGSNPDFGPVIFYTLEEAAGPVQIDILDSEGEEIRSYSSKAKKKTEKASSMPGLNKLVWNGQVPPVKLPKGLLVLGGPSAYTVGPGSYTARLIVGGDTMTQEIEWKADPRMEVPDAAWEAQDQAVSRLYGAMKALYADVEDMRHVKKQVKGLIAQLKAGEDADSALIEQGEKMVAQWDSLEANLVQVKQKTFQDVINYPNKLDAELNNLLGTIMQSTPPLTKGQGELLEDLLGQWEEAHAAVAKSLGSDLEGLNAAIAKAAVPRLSRKTE